MSVDIFTKGFAEKSKWQHACDLINVRDFTGNNVATQHGQPVLPTLLKAKKKGTPAAAANEKGPTGPPLVSSSTNGSYPAGELKKVVARVAEHIAGYLTTADNATCNTCLLYTSDAADE